MKIIFDVVDRHNVTISEITMHFNYLPDEDEMIDLCDEFVEEYRETGAVDCEWREVE
jgi:hypothetical protein